ncbi:hypothetical protein AB4Y36_03555 [Paraburkholderia sp. BR10936]|uniref:hypothetical protein n=1 Tax=Paraburkholderia sp. BR10936 TaxID=3236993 RepID=UPI0034D1ED22
MFNPDKPNNLIQLEASELHTYWHLVRPGLEYMVSEGRNPDGWLPEDIYMALKSSSATLFFTSIMRERAKGLKYATREAAIADSSGFVVLQKTNDYKHAALHIWIAVSNDTTNKSNAGSIMRVFNEELNDVAKNIGCTAITFGSNQDWWDDIAPRFDFSKLETRWRKEVK